MYFFFVFGINRIIIFKFFAVASAKWFIDLSFMFPISVRCSLDAVAYLRVFGGFFHEVKHIRHYLFAFFLVWVLINFDYAIIIEQYVTNCMRFKPSFKEEKHKNDIKIMVPDMAHFILCT